MQLSKKAILLKDSAIEQLTEDINNFKMVTLHHLFTTFIKVLKS